jgi:carbohydrate diacid regulator
MSLLGRDVSLTGTDGTVIASYDPNLVGTRLKGADVAAKSTDAVSLAGTDAVGFGIVYEDEPAAAIIIHADPKSVKEFVPMTKSLVELLITQEADHALADNLDQLLWQFFHSASGTERDKLVSEVRLLGIDLSVPRFVALVNVPDFSQQLSRANDKSVPIHRFKEKLLREVKALFPNSKDNVITYFGHDRFLLLKDASRGEETLKLFQQKGPQMFKNIGGNLTAGIGGNYLGADGVVTSFQEAESALRLGLKLHGPGQAYLVDDLGLYVVFGEVSTDRQVHLAKRLLAPLLKEEDLLKTLRAYFAANLNLTKAAKELHIHRNTLIYRLGKIKNLTKLDPEQFEDAVQLRMALTLIDLG